jgi:hypothetical protein
VVKKGEAFNLEKETKIINPHKVETTTINRQNYTRFDVTPIKKNVRHAEIEVKPMVN